MPNKNVVLSNEVIEKTIREKNYIPSDAKDHMTTEEFREMYGLEVLKSFEKGKDLLEFLFGIKGQNENSLAYSLECNKKITSFFIPAKPGEATTKILNYTNGTWKKFQNNIDDSEAIEIAFNICNSLISVLKNISEDTDATEIRDMLNEQKLNTNQSWLKKYLTILYPSKFMPMSNEDWIKRIFTPLGLTPSDDWYCNAKIFSEKSKEFKIDSVSFYHVVIKCATEQIKSELNELGIDIKQLASEHNLLVNTRSSFNKIKKYISSEDLQKEFENYLSDRYNWGSKPITTTTTISTKDETIPDYIKKYAEKLKSSKNIIFRGAPGTGKTYMAQAIASYIVSNGETAVYDSTNGQIGFTQFHPSYDYTDFIEGLRPINAKNKKDDDSNSEENGSLQIRFDIVDGIFKRFVDKAIGDSDKQKKYVFIIDEINRGEISKILGELFFSIDPDYRGEKGGVFTQYSNMHQDPNKVFYIPENVYIIGTMNDIDRSVDSFDFAMRRRFRFIEITAEESMENILGTENSSVKERMKKLNEAIIAPGTGLNRNYQIGASYFKKLDDKQINEDALWYDFLKPLLQDYVRGLYNEEEIIKSFHDAFYFGNNDNNSIKGDEDDSPESN